MLRYIEQNSGNEFCEQLPQLTEEEAVRIYEEDFKRENFPSEEGLEEVNCGRIQGRLREKVNFGQEYFQGLTAFFMNYVV